MRALTHAEITAVARRGAGALSRWLPADISTAAANNATSLLVEEPAPLCIDLHSALFESVTQVLRVCLAHARRVELTDKQIQRAVNRASVVMEGQILQALGVVGAIPVADEADGAVGSDVDGDHELKGPVGHADEGAH